MAFGRCSSHNASNLDHASSWARGLLGAFSTLHPSPQGMQALCYSEYSVCSYLIFLQVIKQNPYTGGGSVASPLVISFNVPMSSVTSGDFVGANEPAFAPSAQGKISISVDVQISIPVSNVV